MKRQILYRPSLRITRHMAHGRASRFTFDVWNPFAGAYQPAEAIDEGLQRVNRLADVIGQMWQQQHPKLDILEDAPGADGTGSTEWAEFRINATVYRSYDTRRHDRPGWTRAVGKLQATESTFARVGFALPRTKAT